MKGLGTLFIIEARLSIREFSGVLFGLIMPVGVILLFGALFGNAPATEGALYSPFERAVPAVMSIGICASGLMGIPLAVSGYREKKILKRFQVTPSSPLLILTAQVLNSAVLALISGGLVLLIAALFWNYRLPAETGRFMLYYIFVLTAIFALGMLIASISRNVSTANLLCSILYFPSLFLSGATIPFEILPRPLQSVASILPLTQGIRLLKSIGDPGFSFCLPVIVLALTLSGGIVLSLCTFRWE